MPNIYLHVQNGGPPVAPDPVENPQARDTSNKVHLLAIWLFTTALSFAFLPPDAATAVSIIAGLICLAIAFPPPPPNPRGHRETVVQYIPTPSYPIRGDAPPILIPLQNPNVPVGRGHISYPTQYGATPLPRGINFIPPSAPPQQHIPVGRGHITPHGQHVPVGRGHTATP